MTASVCVEAPAKVNLFLRVLRRREDGFHELETLFQAVDLCDEVVLAPAGGGVALEVDGADLGPVEDNLAYRAARAFFDAKTEHPGVRIRLVKRIPAGGGLGGGSSDAAAVLRGLAALFPDLAVDLDLGRVAAHLGSDVAFFLGSSPFAVGKGRGEVLEGLEPLEERSVVLVLPPVHVPTATAYGVLSVQRESGFALAEDERRLGSRPPASWEDVAVRAYNDFETVVPLVHPEVGRALAALSATGGRPTLLSGSGAACFAVYPDRPSAVAAASSLEAELGWPAPLVRTLSAFPEVVVGGS